MKPLVSGALRLFSFGVSAYFLLTFIAAGLILGAWCLAWALLSNLSN